MLSFKVTAKGNTCNVESYAVESKPESQPEAGRAGTGESNYEHYK